MTLSDYLIKYYQPSTVKIYGFEIGHYCAWMGEASAEKANYEDVLRYVSYLRQRQYSSGTIQRIIHAVKRYYYYLQSTGQRKDHPCRLLRLKDLPRTTIQIQDLLTPAELGRLLQREERFASYALRNRLIMSLLVHQALLNSEICGLQLQDVDLEKGQIYVRATPKSNARTLPLQAGQVMLIHRYLSEYRARYLKAKTNALLISGRGYPERGEGVHYLVTTFRTTIPHKKLTPMTIRQSIIANRLKVGQDLRIVQVFAGHRQPSTTEAYRTTNLEELKSAVEKYHPLN